MKAQPLPAAADEPAARPRASRPAEERVGRARLDGPRRQRRLILRAVVLAVATVTTGCPVDRDPSWCQPPCTWRDREHACICPAEELVAAAR